MHRIDETQYFFQSQLLRLFNAKNKQCTLNQPTKIWKQKTDPTGNMRPGGLCLKAKIQLKLCIWWKRSVVPISTMEYSQNGAKKDIDDWWLSSDFLGNSWSVVWACFKRSPFSVHLNFWAWQWTKSREKLLVQVQVCNKNSDVTALGHFHSTKPKSLSI